MDFKDFYAGIDDDSRRLDRIVKRLLPDNAKINAQEIIRKKLVRLNHKKASPSDKVFEGDLISVALFLFGESCISTENEERIEKIHEACDDLDVVFRNRHLLFVNKGRGISVQPGDGKKTSLSDLVSKNYPGFGESLSFRSGPLHRLDKNTTGLVAFSQSLSGAKWFSSMIQTHQIKKTYVALVEGNLFEKNTWIDFIDDSPGESSGGFKTVKIIQNMEHIIEGKKAITHAGPLAHGEFNGKEVTLVQFDIETGRKHQIRCQSSYHGYPLLGDNAYGGHGKIFYLHALRLVFPSDNPLELPGEIFCDIPKDFEEILKICLINWDGQPIIL